MWLSRQIDIKHTVTTIFTFHELSDCLAFDIIAWNTHFLLLVSSKWLWSTGDIEISSKFTGSLPHNQFYMHKSDWSQNSIDAIHIEVMITPHYWSCSSELCMNFVICILRHYFNQSDIAYFKCNAVFFKMMKVVLLLNFLFLDM